MIEPEKDFQPDENEGCDHQIIAKMHAEIETNAFAACANFTPSRKPNPIRVGRDMPPANYASAIRNEKASAAAEVTPCPCLCREPSS